MAIFKLNFQIMSSFFQCLYILASPSNFELCKQIPDQNNDWFGTSKKYCFFFQVKASSSPL